MLGGVADQPAWIVHLVHDRIAGINAGCAANALDLQTVADVDTGWADLDAHGAVDTVAKPHGLVVGIFLPRAALLATARVVGNDQRVLVEHHALEARVRAHVDAHLLTQVASTAVGGEGKEADPERRPAVDVQGE